MKINEDSSVFPTLCHITHYKAGSQWILGILKRCFRERFIQPQYEVRHFLNLPIQQGKIYPTLYLTKQQFDSVQLPSNHRKFIVIRDLRDTLISLYFSLKVSHETTDDHSKSARTILNSMTIESGLKHMIKNNWLHPNTEIQKSWVDSGEPIIRYEDLLNNDLLVLENVLINNFQLPITKQRLHEVIKSMHFANLTGRQPGIEDVNSHYRKGIEGDWKNYFTPEIKQLFKEHYNDILVSSGYEKDLNW